MLTAGPTFSVEKIISVEDPAPIVSSGKCTRGKVEHLKSYTKAKETSEFIASLR